MKQLPVTLICGFAGTGKSTLLQHLLGSRPELQVAVIVNDSADHHSDSQTSVQNLPGSPNSTSVQLSGGCICCSLREDLLEQIVQMAMEQRFDYLLIEASGSADPQSIVGIFDATDDEGNMLSEIAPLDTVVTVVDAERFLDDFQSLDELHHRGLGDVNDDDRDVAQVLTDQVESASVIVINRIDCLPEESRGFLRSLLQQLNPQATLIESEFGRVDPAEVMHTGRYTSVSAAPADEPVGGDGHTGADQELCTFSYRARRPFHPQRFYEFWMNDPLTEGILRSRGFFWLATRCAIAGYWSQSGQVLSAEPAGPWWAESSRDEWPLEDEEMIAEIESVWDSVWGDRRQELKILVHATSANAVQNALNACLLTEDELTGGPDSWLDLEDPFENWDDDQQDDEHEHHDHDCSRDHDHG